MEKIPDTSFLIYANKTSSFDGYIKDGCLYMTSEVYGNGDSCMDSEMHYSFSLEETNKLFSLISVDEFIESCKNGGTMWLHDFLWKNDIQYKTCCI